MANLKIVNEESEKEAGILLIIEGYYWNTKLNAYIMR